MRLNRIQSLYLFKGTSSKVSRISKPTTLTPKGFAHTLFSSPFLFSWVFYTPLPWDARPKEFHAQRSLDASFLLISSIW